MNFTLHTLNNFTRNRLLYFGHLNDVVLGLILQKNFINISEEVALSGQSTSNLRVNFFVYNISAKNRTFEYFCCENLKRLVFEGKVHVNMYSSLPWIFTEQLEIVSIAPGEKVNTAREAVVKEGEFEIQGLIAG